MMPKCPHCGHDMSPEEIGALLNSLRTVHGGGRPRKPRAQRCPCKKSTLKRAKARNYDCCRQAWGEDIFGAWMNGNWGMGLDPSRRTK